MMLTNTTRWSHPPDNQVVPSPWQATFPHGISFTGCLTRYDLLNRQLTLSGPDRLGGDCRNAGVGVKVV